MSIQSNSVLINAVDHTIEHSSSIPVLMDFMRQISLAVSDLSRVSTFASPPTRPSRQSIEALMRDIDRLNEDILQLNFTGEPSDMHIGGDDAKMKAEHAEYVVVLVSKPVNSLARRCAQHLVHLQQKIQGLLASEADVEKLGKPLAQELAALCERVQKLNLALLDTASRDGCAYSLPSVVIPILRRT